MASTISAGPSISANVFRSSLLVVSGAPSDGKSDGVSITSDIGKDLSLGGSAGLGTITLDAKEMNLGTDGTLRVGEGNSIVLQGSNSTLAELRFQGDSQVSYGSSYYASTAGAGTLTLPPAPSGFITAQVQTADGGGFTTFRIPFYPEA